MTSEVMSGQSTPEVPQQHSLKVFIPGMSGGGKDLTEIRHVLHGYYGDTVFVPSSISTSAARRANPGVFGYYKRLGQAIVEKSKQYDQIEMAFHSLGGIEAIDLLRAMRKTPDNRLQGKSIKLTFMALPGVAEDGLKGIKHTAFRLADQFRNVTKYEQHILYPLPEAFYAKQESTPDGVTPIFEDNPASRTKRREIFEAQFLPALLHADKAQIQHVKDTLAEIDRTLLSDPNNSKALQEREKLLKPLLFGLYHGDHYSPEVQRIYLDNYGESPEISKIKELRYKLMLPFIFYMARAGITIGQGVGKKITHEIKSLQRAGANVTVQFALMERDVMLPLGDVPIVDEQMRTELEDTFEGFLLMEQFAHSGIAFYPGIMTEIFSK